MEAIIRNLDYDALESIWKLTFPDDDIEDFMLSFDYTDEEDYLKEIRDVLIDEIKDREYRRQKEQEAHTEALMNMEPQPEIKQKKQMRRKGKKFIEAIKSQHQKRQQRINKLHEIYNNQRDKEEGFYEWLRNKDAPADDERR